MFWLVGLNNQTWEPRKDKLITRGIEEHYFAG